jgi:succinate-semialdehyde dehydrogenase/glutarate-semialdehyde dehydrogenase
MLNLKDPSLLRQQCYIDGAWCDADNAATFTVTNPATGETVGTAPRMGAAETARAIEAANAAWPAWRKTAARERAQILRKWNDLMLENADDLALIMTAEQGKPLAEARGEVGYAASFLEWFGEQASGSKATPCSRRGPTAGWWSRASRSACARRSRRGTFHPR